MNRSGLRVHGNRLIELRKQAGLTQLDLAVRSGYSERVIRKAESGGLLRFETVQDIAQCLSSPQRIVTTADLLRTHLDLAMQFVHAYDHHGRGALEHCDGLFADDFEFYCPGDSEQVAFVGLWSGTEGMQSFFDRFYGIFTRDPGSLKPVYLESKERIVARYEDRVYFDGHSMPPFWVNLHFQFRDGCIARIDDEYDTRLASEAFGELLARLGRLG
ncbi:MAG: helix-turn-helix domain-containing protein [Pirellula sp.]